MNQIELLKHQAAQDQAAIHNLQLRLAAAIRRADGWLPIATAPTDGPAVDIWRACGERCTNMRRVDLGNGNVFYEPVLSGPACVRDATHWMPIPSDPCGAGPAIESQWKARAEKAEAELKALADREPIAWEWWGNKSELWFQCSDKDQAIQYIEEGRKVRAIYASPIIAATPTLHRDATRVIAAWDSTVLPKSHDGRLQQEMEHLRESLKAEHSPIPPEWIVAVTAARDQFLKYAELHLAKDTRDSHEKARVNQHNADVLTALLERAK